MAEIGDRLLQLSKDFVFNGAQGSPYKPDQGPMASPRQPAKRRLFSCQESGCCTMLRLHREREQLGVVADQMGCPTSTATLAMARWRAIGVGIDPAAASWYDFAVAISELGERAALGLEPVHWRLALAHVLKHLQVVRL